MLRIKPLFLVDYGTVVSYRTIPQHLMIPLHVQHAATRHGNLYRIHNTTINILCVTTLACPLRGYMRYHNSRNAGCTPMPMLNKTRLL